MALASIPEPGHWRCVHCAAEVHALNDHCQACGRPRALGSSDLREDAWTVLETIHSLNVDPWTGGWPTLVTMLRTRKLAGSGIDASGKRSVLPPDV